MADLFDSFDELSGRERPRHGGYRFPDNTTHPLSSFSQRGVSMEGLPSLREARRSVFRSNADLEQTKLLYGAAQARTQQLAQIRDAQAGLYEAEQRNRILEHSNAAFDMLKSADPNDPSFERIALDINKNHARAFQDPAFKQAFDFANGIYTRGVKADQDAKKAAGAQQNMLDRQGFAEQERAVRGLSPEYAQMYDQRLAELGPDASDLNRRRSVLNEIRAKAADTDKYAKLEEAGIPWEARRPGERGVDQLINPNTGLLDTAKADSWLRDARVTRDKISAADKFLDEVKEMRKDTINGPALLEANADKIREATELLASGFSSGARKPAEDRAWAAVAGPTRELERLNQQVKAEPDPKKREAIFNQMRPLVAQRDEAAKAHPGFNLSLTPEEGETKAQMLNRLEDNARMLLRWPIGAPITVNGKPVKGGWTEADRETQVALLARIDGGGARQTPKALSSEEPRAQVDDYYNRSVVKDAAPAPTAAVPQVSPQQRRDEEIKAAALDRLKIPADPETAARLEAELAQVPKTGFWAALEKHGGDPGTGSNAQEAVWSMFAGKAKQVHVEDRLKKLGDLYNAELEVLNPKPSVFEQLKQGATRDPKAPSPRLKLPPEKEAAYENAALEILADTDPDAGSTAMERADWLRKRDLGLALRKARQEQLTAELKK